MHLHFNNHNYYQGTNFVSAELPLTQIAVTVGGGGGGCTCMHNIISDRPTCMDHDVATSRL